MTSAETDPQGAAAPTPTSVSSLQRWMQAVITTPGGAVDGLATVEASAERELTPEALESVVLPAARVSALERLQIYCDQYIWRLERVLGEQFASVKHALGKQAFRTLAREYLASYPPRHWSLSQLGLDFPRYLREEAQEVPLRAFVSELAELECAMREVFDAERSELLSTDDVLAVPQERWAEAGLQTIPALRLMRFEWPVNAYLSDQRHDRAPEPPEQPRETRLVVWRKQWKTWRLELDPAPFAILEALSGGLPLGEALEEATNQVEIGAEEVQRLGDWFQVWSGEGMLARFNIPERENP